MYPVIWWLSHADCDAIGPELWPAFPPPIQREYLALVGREGRGRIWDSCDSDVTIDKWPSTPLAVYIERYCGGIVVFDSAIALIRRMPGIVTDRDMTRRL